MKTSLVPGIQHEKRYTVPVDKTVPHVYPESQMFRDMPQVFASAYLVGLLEWACMEAIQPHLDASEGSVGTDFRLTHSAATPPGLTVTVSVALERVEGRKLTFRVSAHDGVDPICEGTHDRFVVDAGRFAKRVAEKASRAGPPGGAGSR